MYVYVYKRAVAGAAYFFSLSMSFFEITADCQILFVSCLPGFADRKRNLHCV